MPRLSRREVLSASLAAGLLPAVASAQPTAGFELVLRPTRFYKTRDQSHENTESWIGSLIVQSASPDPLTPFALRIELQRAGKTVKTIDCNEHGVGPMTYKTSFHPTLPDGSAPPSPIYWPFVVRLRQTEPTALAIDAMKVSVTALTAGKEQKTAEILIPVETYTQKNKLLFPFAGKGIILQAGATNGGHRNRSGAFALDACGLDDAWSVVAPGPGKKNEDYRGWGRTLIAPADGTVVRARHDRPDQPVADVSDPAFYAPEYPNGGDPGNFLVIDHGQGEFSMIAHFMAGSMLVKAGDKVRASQPLGKLGHSGDTDGPHCHYQLQAGPDWEYADALPCRFTNVEQEQLSRGTYFETK